MSSTVQLKVCYPPQRPPSAREQPFLSTFRYRGKSFSAGLLPSRLLGQDLIDGQYDLESREVKRRSGCTTTLPTKRRSTVLRGVSSRGVAVVEKSESERVPSEIEVHDSLLM